MNKQHLILLLYIIEKFPYISDIDLDSLCLESLQIDFFLLAPLKEHLIQENLAQKEDPTKLVFIDPSFDDNNQPIPVWSLTEEGQKLKSHLNLNLPSGSLNFLDEILNNYRKKQQQIFKHVAFINTSLIQNIEIKFLNLQTYRKNVIFFNLKLPIENEEYALHLIHKWESQEQHYIDFPFFLQLCELNKKFLEL